MLIDLNCDMGESFSNYKIGLDDEVIKHITSANIACGFHAGDPIVMNRTVHLAAVNGVSVGAHPGFPDMMGFGRRNMDCTADEIRSYIIYQVGALKGFCRANGVKLHHVKPHGNLYLTAVENRTVARAIAEGIVSVDPKLTYVALAGAKGEMMTRVGEEVGLKVVYEAFPDRAYTPEGTLAPRRDKGSVIHDPEVVAARALDMANGFVIALNGARLELNAQTLCVHGDNPSAVELVSTIRARLEAEGIEVKPMAAQD